MKKVMALAAAGCVALAISVSAGAVPCCITNGSFNTGDLTGWTTTAGGWTSGTTAGGAPGQGAFHGWANAATSSNSLGGLTQSFVAPAGRVFGWAKFDDAEVASCPDGDIGIDDIARVRVDGVDVFVASSNTTGSTGWVQWSKQVSNVGVHTVQGLVQNTSDSACDSQINVDGIVWDARLSKLP